AKTRLDDILDGETRNVIASHDLVEIIRTTNRTLQFGDIFREQKTVNPSRAINFGRDYITKSIIEAASPRLKELGIELLDLKLKRINYVKEVQRKIFDRMIAERKRIAERFRSEGRGMAAEILGKKERELRKIRSEAYREAQKIMGKADAEATLIYASAYNQSKEARDFYRFLKTMEVYKNTLSEKDWLIISTEGELFKLLRKPLSKASRP
ncbi:MAG: protease modulator HflC, partial [Nitrospirae bacterium]